MHNNNNNNNKQTNKRTNNPVPLEIRDTYRDSSQPFPEFQPQCPAPKAEGEIGKRKKNYMYALIYLSPLPSISYYLLLRPFCACIKCHRGNNNNQTSNRFVRISSYVCIYVCMYIYTTAKRNSHRAPSILDQNWKSSLRQATINHATSAPSSSSPSSTAPEADQSTPPNHSD